MTGELDDPLLHSGIGGMHDGDSGMNQRDMDDYGDGGGKGEKAFDDSELSNGIVGIDTSKKPRAQ
jgi:hypothetical protein